MASLSLSSSLSHSLYISLSLSLTLAIPLRRMWRESLVRMDSSTEVVKRGDDGAPFLSPTPHLPAQPLTTTRSYEQQQQQKRRNTKTLHLRFRGLKNRRFLRWTGVHISLHFYASLWLLSECVVRLRCVYCVLCMDKTKLGETILVKSEEMGQPYIKV